MDDPFDFIRGNKWMFLSETPSVPEQLVPRLVEEVVVLGGKDVGIRHCGQWWIVGADVDWLQYAPKPTPRAPRDLFFYITAFPELGREAMRVEVLLTAFTEAVVTTGQERLVIKGEVLHDDPIWNLMDQPGWKRAVAFLPSQQG